MPSHYLSLFDLLMARWNWATVLVLAFIFGSHIQVRKS